MPPGALVCVVDDDESVRRSLVRVLGSAGLRVESFGSAKDYLQRPVPEESCCLLLDVLMPGLGGLELQRVLVDRGDQIVFLTGHGDVPQCATAMKAGAVDFLTKPVDDETLLAAISRAIGRSAESRRVAAERGSARARFGTLTPREIEVMQHVIAGLLNKQIADELGTAEKTIKIHRGRVMEKMAVASVAELVRVAQAAGVQPAAAPSWR